jgi:uncharacterized protein YegL
MKENYVNVCFIIDQSGSMYGSEADVIGGFQKVIDEQRAVKEGKCTVSMFKFEDRVEECFVGKDVNEVGVLDYTPGGCTALNDAVCIAVDRIGEWLASMPESERPAKNMVVVITDGMENASRRYTHKDARERIQHQTDKYGWTFVYLGANITDATEAREMGFENTGYMDKKDLNRAFGAIHNVAYCFRSCKNDEDANLFLDKELADMTAEFEQESGVEIKGK